MKIIKGFMYLCLFMIPIGILAQSVTGTVTEGDTGFTLSDVSVKNLSTLEEVYSDTEGSYSITADSGDVLVFSALGFQDQEFIYGAQDVINVVMSAEQLTRLDELVIIGYGAVQQKDATGTLDHITSEEFNPGPIVSAGQLIAGKVAGVSVTSTSGAPGEGQEIIIRGRGSLRLTSSPLIVIDGVPIDNNSIGGSRNVLDFVNPNDIESMTILKDASSTAIYGSRAANGVIMITTKKGRGKVKFNYSGFTTVYEPVDFVEMMSGNQFRELIQTTGTASAIGLLGSENTDWQKLIYKTAVGFDHSFSASGSINGKLPFRVSLGYSDHDGILRGDNFQRTTASFNIRPTFLDNHLTVELNGRGMYTENIFANRDAIGAALDFNPTFGVYGGPEHFGGYSGWYVLGGPNGLVQHNLATTNPVALLNYKDDTSEVRRFVGNAKIDYKMHFLPELTATVNLAYDITNANGRTIVSPNMPNSSLDWIGSYYSYSNENTSKLFEGYLTYNKDFGKHNLNVMAGHSYQMNEYYSYAYNGLLLQQGSDDYQFVDRSRFVMMSYFGRASYNYDDRYLLTATLRADASSQLNPKDQWGYFPSFAAAWNLHNEKFFNVSFINQLKFRAGYGEIANANGLGAYGHINNYTRSQGTAYYQFGPNFYQTYRPDAFNPNIKWEVGKTWNVGLDYELFNSRVFGSVNAYLKETNDLIAFVTVDPFTNFSNSIAANVGDMENKGIEIDFNVIPVKTKNFEWTIGYNISFNENTITNIPADIVTGGINGGTNNTIQIHREGYSPFSYFVYKQIYDDNGRPIEGAFVDRNGDGVINNDDRYIYKDPYADIIMGLNTNLRYKNWDLTVITRANFGNYAYNNVTSSRSHLIRATENGMLNNIHTDYFNTGLTLLTTEGLQSDHYVQDASFFKVDNITLGYKFPNFIKQGMGLRVYGSVQNVLVVTDYEGIDPEINTGIDNNIYPRPRAFLFGINLDF